MSSHSVKLAQRLKDFRKIQKLLKREAICEYSRGLYNGLELAWSLMNKGEPEYLLTSENSEVECLKKENEEMRFRLESLDK